MNSSNYLVKISKEYNKLYENIDSVTNNNLQTLYILNDIFILSILFKKKSINKKSLIFDLRKKYKNILFLNDIIFSKYETLILNVFDKVIKLINNCKDINMFEKMFGVVLEKRINRKETGSYYTPDDTTKYICWNAIFISILNNLPYNINTKIANCINISNNVEFIDKKLTFEEKIRIVKISLKTTDIDKICYVIKRLRIIDPTCGSGAFIISAYDCIKFLNENLLDGKLEKNYYYKNLFGLDIQEEAISLSKVRLIIKTVIDDNYSKELNKALECNLKCADALKGPDQLIDGDINEFNWNGFGLFDCIVGNPPYVEVKNKVEYNNYNSVKCGNLYAYVIERSCNIANKNSIISLVVPLPLISTTRMSTIKKYLESKSSLIYYCSFADRPGCLFSGVHQRLTIFFANIGCCECRKFTSSYKFWYKAERNDLFKSLEFIENRNSSMPKIGNSIENSIYLKNRICTNSISTLSSKDGKYELYISTRIGFWTKAFLESPSSNEISKINFKDDNMRKIAYCFINSSYFYFQWVIISDCWHVTNADLSRIKFNFDTLTFKQKNKLVELANLLALDLENNKVRINSKQTEYEYKHKYSKKIIDKIDDIICQNAGLDLQETKFIKNYTLKYRVNRSKEG